MRDVFDDGSVLILKDSEVWVGTAQGQVQPTLVLFEVEEGTFIVEYDATRGEAFEQLESMSTIDEGFWFENSNEFFKLDETAFMMLRMVL